MVFEIVVPISGNLVYASAEEARAVLKPPKPPYKWGTSAAARFGLDLAEARVSIRDPDVERGASSAKVTFAPMLLCPHTSEPLDPVHIALPEGIPGDAVVNWRATSLSTDGEFKGSIRLQLA